MTVHEEWTDQLSDYLDGDLPAAERSAVEAHLRSCAPCAAVLHDLRRVVAQAQSVKARPPHSDLWIGIADRIETGRPAAEPGRVVPFLGRDAKRFTFTLLQLVAAAALVMVVSGGIAWKIALGGPGQRQAASAPETTFGRDGAQPPSPGYGEPRRSSPDDGASEGGGFSPASASPVNMADAQYDAAVADLEKALNAGRGRLEASTIAIVEHNIHIIDQAINQAREALVTDPANSYLSSHLVDARRRKLDLLRRATALAAETN